MMKTTVGTAIVGVDVGVLTPAQASAVLQVPAKTLAVWRSTNRVRLAYCKIGSAVRYRRADLERFIAQNMRNADESAG